jgi:hypothetical protein
MTTLISDWQESGMWHVPPVLMACEMTGELPCLQELWEANDAVEFDAVIAAKGHDCWKRTPSLRQCVDVLMGDAWPGVERFPLKHLSIPDVQLFLFGKAVPSFPGIINFRSTDYWKPFTP